MEFCRISWGQTANPDDNACAKIPLAKGLFLFSECDKTYVCLGFGPMLYYHQNKTKPHLERRMQMGQKWGRNEGVHIGDIFECVYGPYLSNPDSDYYQVVALRGKAQVVLRPLRTEKYINEGIEEGSSLYWRRERKRPLPGQFLTEDEVVPIARHERGKEILRTGVEVTAWVLPYRTVENRPCLQEVRWKASFVLALPEDWEPWDAEKIKELEEEDRAEKEAFKEHFERIRRGEAKWGCP